MRRLEDLGLSQEEILSLLEESVRETEDRIKHLMQQIAEYRHRTKKLAVQKAVLESCDSLPQGFLEAVAREMEQIADHQLKADDELVCQLDVLEDYKKELAAWRSRHQIASGEKLATARAKNKRD